MKASEMTNEELANFFDELSSFNRDDDKFREAAARLRKKDITVVAQKEKGAAEKTNEQKYRTVEERVKAYARHEGLNRNQMGVIHAEMVFNWLASEVKEEKPLPCYECGGEMVGEKGMWSGKDVCYLRCAKCGHSTGSHTDFQSATAAHNRVFRLVESAKK